MTETQSISNLAYKSAFGASEQDKTEVRAEIRQLAKERGIYPASIHELYLAFGRGEVSGFSTPACNIRALTYDTARLVFRLLKELKASAFIFEIARGELGYTDQTADEYSASILAAAVAEDWKGPVFIQADHTQFSAYKFKNMQETAINDLKDIIKKSIEAGFYNIDIDASTLVDLANPDLDKQQKNNYEMTALLTEYTRSLEPQGVTVSIGGEIGHIGGVNSTVGDFKAFIDGFKSKYQGVGLSKVSVQTGTSHGGTILPDGTMKQVNLDFNVLKDIGAVARQYGLGGPVQHGASTLPLDMFNRFPEVGTVEVHLATGFQNTVFNNLPGTMQKDIYDWTVKNCAADRKPEWNDDQLVYKMRKKANKPFKKVLWDLGESDKKKVMDALEAEFRTIFAKLNIKDSAAVVSRYVKP